MVSDQEKQAFVERVKSLGININDVKRVEYWSGIEGELPNMPGKQNSLMLTLAHSRKVIEGGKENRAETKLYRGTERAHTTIEILEDIASGREPPIHLNVVRHPEIEELSQEKEQFFRNPVVSTYGTPTFWHFEDGLEQNMKELLAFPAPFGLTVRYAMKANANSAIVRFFYKMGAHIDASTPEEATRAMRAAQIPGNKIQLTSQVVPSRSDLETLLKSGVLYNACSLNQLELFGSIPREIRGDKVGIRFNIGLSSGWTSQTGTGGVNSSFGIYEHREDIRTILRKYNLDLDLVHLHIGSGADPEKQKQAAMLGIEVLREFPSARRLSFGGGIKEKRMNYEKRTDIQELGKPVAEALIAFANETGRRMPIEIEPGTRAVASAVYLASRAMDIVDTGKNGYTFVKLDVGMPHITRPMLYGAQHPIIPIQADNDSRQIKDQIFVGPCCESGDLLSPRPGKPEEVDVRRTREVKVN